jgi:hypothetical protein
MKENVGGMDGIDLGRCGSRGKDMMQGEARNAWLQTELAAWGPETK